MTYALSGNHITNQERNIMTMLVMQGNILTQCILNSKSQPKWALHKHTEAWCFKIYFFIKLLSSKMHQINDHSGMFSASTRKRHARLDTCSQQYANKCESAAVQSSTLLKLNIYMDKKENKIADTRYSFTSVHCQRTVTISLLVARWKVYSFMHHIMI